MCISCELWYYTLQRRQLRQDTDNSYNKFHTYPSMLFISICPRHLQGKETIISPVTAAWRWAAQGCLDLSTPHRPVPTLACLATLEHIFQYFILCLTYFQVPKKTHHKLICIDNSWDCARRTRKNTIVSLIHKHTHKYIVRTYLFIYLFSFYSFTYF